MTDKTHTMILSELLRTFRREMNGAVVEDMERWGSRYNLNFGVTIPVLRKIAARYAPDQELADFLFKQDFREARLMAIYIADPEKTSARQMREWAAAMNTELMENGANFLFAFSPAASEILSEWLASEDTVLNKGALYMIGRRIMKSLGGGEQPAQLLPAILRLASKEDPGLVRPLIFALSKISGLSESLRIRTEEWFETHSATSPYLRHLSEEIAALTGR